METPFSFEIVQKSPKTQKVETRTNINNHNGFLLITNNRKENQLDSIPAPSTIFFKRLFTRFGLPRCVRQLQGEHRHLAAGVMMINYSTLPQKVTIALMTPVSG